MQDLIAMTKALADETRVRALMSLAEGELCVCQIIEVLDLAPSTVSKHMSILQGAGLVQRRKDGRWCYYRLADDEDTTAAARQMIDWVLTHFEQAETIANDAAKRAGVRQQRREELTACYCGVGRDTGKATLTALTADVD